MSRWTHYICERCWERERPGQIPVRLVIEHRAVDPCCCCGEPTSNGIYVRGDPAAYLCGGVHPEQPA